MLSHAFHVAGVAAAPRPVVCAVLMPHAPVLVPAIGAARGNAAAASCRSMRTAAAMVLRYQPDSLVVISPHAPRQSGAFGLWADARLEGSFAQFGAPQVQVSLPNDRRLADAIAVEAQLRRVAVWAIHHHQLDHGALVPLWFLGEAGWTGPTVIVSLDDSEDGELASLGGAIAAAAKQLRRRLAIIASGDMSHRLTRTAPCGFHPQARQFDQTFIRLVRSGDYEKIPNINPELREVAAEDAVEATLIAAAATAWSSARHKVLSYEGPFGVGYGVAILFADAAALPVESPGAEPAVADGEILPAVARRSVAAALRGSPEAAPAATGAYLTKRSGVFVTLRDREGALRGCVGTVAPVGANLVEETWHNARLAALQDDRFPPVTPGELEDLRFEISVLHSIETVSAAELNPGRYGVIVTAEDGRRGVLLPGIASVPTSAAQLQLARQKGGIAADEPVTLQRFEVDRFAEPNESQNA